MSNYNLKINLLSNDVSEINRAYQKITIMKVVGDSAGMQLVWVSFSPFEHNEVRWESTYGVYASSSTVQGGAQIFRTSVVNPATSGIVYPFEDGTFSSPTSGGLSNAYSISNKTNSKFTFGLAQSVTVNGDKFHANALNAVTVLTDQDASFKPIEKIHVFLHANFNDGMVISDITSPALLIDFTNEPSNCIRYDAQSGQFVIA